MLIRTNENAHPEKYILRLLESKDKNINVAKVDRIYYPYAIMVYRIRMKNPDSLMNRRIMCVMDMAAGRGAIGDEDPSLVEKEVDDILVVDATLSEDELRQKGHDFVFRTVMGKIRVLYVPAIDLESVEYFHKLYYVIHCKDSDDKDYFLLADSVDAAFTELESPSQG